MPYFTTPDNCKLYYVIHNFEPSRPLVVFLNGTSQTTIYWEPHVSAFSEHFGVLRYDARSQGQSDMGSRGISAEIHISDLHGLLDHLNAQQTHLMQPTNLHQWLHKREHNSDTPKSPLLPSVSGQHYRDEPDKERNGKETEEDLRFNTGICVIENGRRKRNV